MKCATSFRYARLLRALFRLANHTSSSGIKANASMLMRAGSTCLDFAAAGRDTGTSARVFFFLASFPRFLDTLPFRMVLFPLFFRFISYAVLIRDNRVYHALTIPTR
jgi:hypothetical protein